MNLNPIKANMTELELDGMRVLFSYKTPVAALVREESPEGTNWHQYKTDKFWSKTTNRHINAWNPKGGAYGVKPQEWFDNLTAGVK
jgi:hypothetical protein